MDLTTYPQLVIPRNSEFAQFQAAGAYEGTVNCAAAGGAAATNWGVPNLDHIVTHHEFRLAAGNPKDANGRPTGLGSIGVQAAFQHFGAKSELFRGKSTSIARDALEAGCVVCCCVDYGTITDLAPALSGQPSFRKGHFIDLYSWRWSDPAAAGHPDTVVDHDTLFDGRHRPTYTAPEGPQVAPFSVFAAALGNFRIGSTTGRYADGHPVGKGLGVFIVVSPQ